MSLKYFPPELRESVMHVEQNYPDEADRAKILQTDRFKPMRLQMWQKLMEIEGIGEERARYLVRLRKGVSWTSWWQGCAQMLLDDPEALLELRTPRNEARNQVFDRLSGVMRARGSEKDYTPPKPQRMFTRESVKALREQLILWINE